MEQDFTLGAAEAPYKKCQLLGVFSWSRTRFAEIEADDVSDVPALRSFLVEQDQLLFRDRIERKSVPALRSFLVEQDFICQTNLMLEVMCQLLGVFSWSRTSFVRTDADVKKPGASS